jgi:hypothetical protein
MIYGNFTGAPLEVRTFNRSEADPRGVWRRAAK